MGILNENLREDEIITEYVKVGPGIFALNPHYQRFRPAPIKAKVVKQGLGMGLTLPLTGQLAKALLHASWDDEITTSVGDGRIKITVVKRDQADLSAGETRDLFVAIALAEDTYDELRKLGRDEYETADSIVARLIGSYEKNAKEVPREKRQNETRFLAIGFTTTTESQLTALCREDETFDDVVRRLIESHRRPT